MKRFFSYVCFALLAGLVAFTGPIREKGTITFTTAAGEQTYSCVNVPMRLDASNGQVRFYFKPASFKSGDARKDAQLIQMTQGDVYGTLSFSGQLEKSAADLSEGSSLSTAAIGTLNFAGKQRSLRVPVQVTKLKGEYFYSFSALVDWANIPAINTAGQQLGVQGPIRINIGRNL